MCWCYQWLIQFNKSYFRQAHDAKSEDIRGESTLLELRRQYHCAAYNLMIAFISRTQTDLKYFTAFLFEEKEAKVVKNYSCQCNSEINVNWASLTWFWISLIFASTALQRIMKFALFLTLLWYIVYKMSDQKFIFSWICQNYSNF